jgi:hypothetical protein
VSIALWLGSIKERARFVFRCVDNTRLASPSSRLNLGRDSRCDRSTWYERIIMDWLSQEGPKADKHRGWLHPLAVCIVHYVISTVVTFWAHDILLDRFISTTTTATSTTTSKSTTASLSPRVEDQDSLLLLCGGSDADARRYRIAVLWLLPYSLWLLVWRLMIHDPPVYRHCVLYEYCWLCNATLNIGAAGLLTNRPIIASAYCVTVGIDQLLWYIDLSVYLVCGKFPFGVSKYIFWEGVTWISRITCTHHLWTIPVLLYAAQGMHCLAFPLSVILMMTHVFLSRWMTPSHVVACAAVDEKGNETAVEPKYLNVNLSHALWKDIKIGLLQINYDDPPVHVYLFRLLWRWEGFNAVVFVILYTICHGVFGDAPVC